MSVSKKLKELRESAGLSQQGTAEKLDMSKQMYIELENGQREPDLGDLHALMKLYNITMMELVAEEGDDWPGVISEPLGTYAQQKLSESLVLRK